MPHNPQTVTMDTKEKIQINSYNDLDLDFLNMAAKKQFKEPPYQIYSFWLSEWMRMGIMWGHYILGANVPAKGFVKEYKSKFGAKIHVEGRAREANLERADSMLIPPERIPKTLGAYNNLEATRKEMPPELGIATNVTQWHAIYLIIELLWQRYVEERNWFILNNDPLIKKLMINSIGYRTMKGAQEDSDLSHEALLGAIKADDKYKFTSGHKISTLMALHIQNTTKDAIDTSMSIIRTPPHVQGTKRRIQEIINEYYEEFGRKPSKEYIKEKIGKTKTKVEYIMDIDYNHTINLDAPVGDDGDTTFSEIIAAPEETNSLLFPIEKEELATRLNKALEQLPTELRLAVTCYCQYRGVDGDVIANIAECLGKTKARARQILHKAFQRLSRDPRIAIFSEKELTLHERLQR
jgi:RNA polymerase primary sigma factor